MRLLRSLGELARAKGGDAALRYFAVILCGFVIDLSISWSTHALLGVNLIAAAALGYAVAMTLSYFAHEFWTFRRAESGYSSTRVMKFVLASAAVLGARLTLVAVTAPLGETPSIALVRLLFAFGGSMIVGFFINRLLVFNAGPARPGE